MSHPTELSTGRPADWLALACRTWGEVAVADRCAALMTGAPVDAELLPYLGGPAALSMLAIGRWTDAQLYWPRVWGARGLLYAWHDAVSAEVRAALRDEAWRVREMAGKVVARHEVDSAGDALAGLLTDPVPRVRAAAARALGVVGEAEHAPALRTLRTDEDATVRRRADEALARLTDRLDRDLT